MIRVFHGSNIVVREPLVGIGRENLDFDLDAAVANDRVIDTVENYRAGLIDEDTALRLLSLHQPNHQICITRQEVVDRFLRFTDSYQVEVYVE